MIRYTDPKLVAANVERALREGFRDVKLHEIEVAPTQAAREAAGEDIGLMLDVNCPWTLREALDMAEKLRPLHLRWLEEPVWPPEDHSALAQIRARGSIPIAAGENAATLAQFKHLFDAGAVDFVQPSPAKMGGVSELRKVFTLAAAYNVTVMPHSFYDGPAFPGRSACQRSAGTWLHGGVALLRPGGASLWGPGDASQRLDRRSSNAWLGIRPRSAGHKTLSRRLKRMACLPGCVARKIGLMNLERITVEFHAEEDRLMARVFFDKSAEIQFWLTRRLVGRIWPVLLQVAQAKPDIQMQPNPEVRKALLGMQHEKALREVKFSKATQQPAREHPLGNAPMLVSKVRARRNEKGPDRIVAAAAGGQWGGPGAGRHAIARTDETGAGHGC
jgi:hypothetical protein